MNEMREVIVRERKHFRFLDIRKESSKLKLTAEVEMN